MPSTEIVRRGPAAPAPDVAICSYSHDAEPCKEPAQFAYTWDWGETGTCCAKHQIVLAQKSKTLKRGIQFVPLNAGVPAPMQREERVRLTAEMLVAKEELAEAKQRGLELYQSNKALAGQVQLLTVQNRELTAQLQDAQVGLGRFQGEYEALKIQLAETTDELSRLKVLLDATELTPVDDKKSKK